MNLEKDYAELSDIQLREIMRANYGGSPAYIAASNILSKRESEQKTQLIEDKQNDKKWQQHVQRLLERSDRKTLYILIVSLVTLLLALVEYFRM